MAFKIKDVKRYKRGLNTEQEKKWKAIANESLRSCVAQGGKILTCEINAVRTANQSFNKEKNMDIQLSEKKIDNLQFELDQNPLYMPCQEADKEKEWQLAFPIGAWYLEWYGEVIVTRTFIDKIVENFKNKILNQRQPFIDTNHDGGESNGWILDMKTGEEGLEIQVDWTEKGIDLLENKIYKYFSATIESKLNIETNERVWPVVTMVTLTNRPAMNTMPEVIAASDENNVIDNESMTFPYPNEHAARLQDPDKFDPKTFRRTAGGTIYGSIKVPNSISIIWGKLKGKVKPSDPLIAQSLRFDKTKWTVDKANKWLKDNKIKYISFEKASNKSSNNSTHSDGSEDIKEFKYMDFTEILKALPALADEEKTIILKELKVYDLKQEYELLLSENKDLKEKNEILDKINKEVSTKYNDLTKECMVKAKKEVIDQALKDGKILPSNRQDWEERFDKHPDFVKGILEKLPKVIGFKEAGTDNPGNSINSEELNERYQVIMGLKNLDYTDKQIIEQGYTAEEIKEAINGTNRG